LENNGDLKAYFDQLAPFQDKWNKKNRLYHKILEKHFSLIIPEGSKVLEMGCSTGNLLNSVRPSLGVGVDFSEKMVEIACTKFPHLQFVCSDVTTFRSDITFDYIIISDLLGSLLDIQSFLKNLRDLCHPRSRIIFSSYNYLWEPVLKLGEIAGIVARQPKQSWLTVKDIQNLLEIENFEIIRTDRKLLLPKYFPLLHSIFNVFLSNLPLLNRLNLINLIYARPVKRSLLRYSVSIIIPAKNERKNIEHAIRRTPVFGLHQEFIFIEGHSSDNTFEEMERVQREYPGKDIRIMQQTGKGKGNAVREAFEMATGDILMILDADLTTPPEDLCKFYDAIAGNAGEFINGCRLIYPMEKEAMRFLNLIGNKFFSLIFTFLLGQRLKDTLCGTKVLFRKDYNNIKLNRKYFGEFDPFGDFDLLFGAAKLNLKIVEVPVRYYERRYGSSQINRFRHGWLLLRMCFFAAKKIKFIA
jgi:2-polyprenyl-3-methyl-5-hydroxy-6-metoxy-1,4-benzoquinol methylase